MTAIFNTWLPFYKAIATDETLATQHSHIVVSRKISPDIEKLRKAIEIKT